MQIMSFLIICIQWPSFVLLRVPYIVKNKSGILCTILSENNYFVSLDSNLIHLSFQVLVI